MSKQSDFIEKIGPAFQRVAKANGIGIVSFGIAQACYETGYGDSKLAKEQNNFGGIKSSKHPSGYAAYSSMDEFVEKGYYGGTVLGQMLKEQKPTTLEQYADIFNKSGYCPDAGYVQNVNSIIDTYNLKSYDDMTNVSASGSSGVGALALKNPTTGQQILVTRQPGFSNSQLVGCTILNDNNRDRERRPISLITIHTMAGKMSAESCGRWFKNSCPYTSNYGIGYDGKIGLYLEESKVSWCSTSESNDTMAVTIEVSSKDSKPPYECTEEAYNSLISLCADICIRNGISDLRFDPSDEELAKTGRFGSMKGNMTAHKWFADKDCPGEYLYDRFPEIASRVSSMLKNVGGSAINYSYSRGDALIREFGYYDGKTYARSDSKSDNKLSVLNYAGVLQSELGIGQSIGGASSAFDGGATEGGDPSGYGNGSNPNETAPKQGTKTSQPSGEEVPAQFTAYYPADNLMEGGFNDCKGFKLNPNNQTCAAPGSIPYASYLWIKDCEGRPDYNNRLYVVTDRGGAIVIKNGVYHIDLLFPDERTANDFGRRNGKIVIHNRNYDETKKM